MLPWFLVSYIVFGCVAAIVVSVFVIFQIPVLLVAFLNVPFWVFLAETPIPSSLNVLGHLIWHWLAVSLLASFVEPIAWYINTTAEFLDSTVLVFLETNLVLGHELTSTMTFSETLMTTPVWALLNVLVGVAGVCACLGFVVWLKLEA